MKYLICLPAWPLTDIGEMWANVLLNYWNINNIWGELQVFYTNYKKFVKTWSIQWQEKWKDAKPDEIK